MTIYKFAGFWRRFVAYMIDGFILGVIMFVMIIIATIAYISGAMAGDSRALMAKMLDPEQLSVFILWGWLLSTLLNIVYFTYFYGTSGRTPGKMLIGLQVVTTEGKPLSFGIAFLRSVGYLVSSFLFCLGFIWVGFDKRKQGWHDKIAGTVVIIREPDGSAAGIAIPDASDAPAPPPPPVQSADVVAPVDQAPPDTSAGDPQAPNNQKIP